jgi:anaerobic selenocysteine-containing dehydrogenase
LSTPNDDRKFTDGSRLPRRMVLQAALAAAIVGGAGAAARAQSKAKKSLVQYQQNPKGGQQCDNCLLWEPPDACKVVEGKISPKGWCAVYQPKPK